LPNKKVEKKQKNVALSSIEKATKQLFWASPVYKYNGFGFYLSKVGEKYFIGYQHVDGRMTEINIKKNTFDVIKKEWSS
jgi:hypothetical protein